MRPILVDAASATPPFEQVRAQLAERIRAGSLAPGARLPTVRRLAEDLGLAVNTVARTYRELEAEGLVETRGRNGTVVSWSSDDAVGLLEQEAARFAERARALGIGPDVALRLAGTALGSVPAR